MTPLPSLCPAKNVPSGHPNATQEMVGCDRNCDRMHHLAHLGVARLEHFSEQQACAPPTCDERASEVIDCSSSPTADTIWSLMVSARVWLTCWAVRHHSKCTPTALTTIDVSTRAEMALRMPMRMRGPGSRGRLPQYGTILASVSPARPIPAPFICLGHGSVTRVEPEADETYRLPVPYKPRRRYALRQFSKVMQCTMFPSRRP